MLVKTSELKDHALDWAVAHIEENVPLTEFIALLGLPEADNFWKYRYPTDWAQGGPIIEREKITLLWQPPSYDGGRWFACIGDALDDETLGQHHESSPLIAAMRCYVASKLGDEVEIPEELK